MKYYIGIDLGGTNIVAGLVDENYRILNKVSRKTNRPRPAEEIAAFKALHSNKPNTTVYNGSGAHMAVEYIADTKTYIDNKFAELQNAILSAGANI